MVRLRKFVSFLFDKDFELKFSPAAENRKIKAVNFSGFNLKNSR